VVQFHLESEEERSLLQNACGNFEAFQKLYRAYFPRVYAYVAYRVGKALEAEDITSDVFLKVIEKLSEFEWRGEGSFAAWIFRIAHDRVIDFHRQDLWVEAVLSIDELPDLRANELLPAEIILQKEKFVYLQRLIANLSPRRREIITLKFFGGLRNKEIAKVLGLDERTVASHLCRGLEHLHQEYIKSYNPVMREDSDERTG
jgi:RNA polymerase sigma-70 factor (ECF subfamily)